MISAQSLPSIPRVIPIVTGIAPLTDGVDVWICDIWGVVHNGVSAFQPAVEACRTFRKRGGSVLLLTNAPRPAAAIEAQLAKLAVPPDAYDAVLTSGDLTRNLIARYRQDPMLHLGPERDRGLFDGQAIDLVGLDQARVVICSGLYDDDRDTAEDYRQRLIGLAARSVPMICANPDLTVARGDRIIPCAGAIAKLYEEVGGNVIYAGKPYLPVYERAFEMIGEIRGKRVALERIVAIGDGVRTDILGAANAGLRAVFVASPVHFEGELTSASLTRLFGGAASGAPIAAMAALAW